jgi:hypothetical protein
MFGDAATSSENGRDNYPDHVNEREKAQKAQGKQADPLQLILNVGREPLDGHEVGRKSASE